MIKQLEEIRDTLYEFLETRIELFRVETRGRIEDIIVRMVYAALIISICVVILMFLLLIAAIFLNEKLESPYAGYLIIAGFFALALLVLVIFRKPCKVVIRDILQNILKK